MQLITVIEANREWGGAGGRDGFAQRQSEQHPVMYNIKKEIYFSVLIPVISYKRSP